MPRKARKYVRAPFFHVMCQGIKKENIFCCKKNIQKYLSLIKKYKNEFFIDIVAYCIMPNHVHLLLHTYNIENLSKFMHKLNCVYGMYYNTQKERVGYVFRDRFKMEEITDNKYLNACIIYIHNNPVKAGICNLPEQYKYSSYYEFTKKSELINKTIVNKITNNTPYLKLEEELKYNNIEYVDIEMTPEEKLKEIVSEFEKRTNKPLAKILSNYNDKKALLIELHIKNKISYRCIEKNLQIKRRTIPNYITNQ